MASSNNLLEEIDRLYDDAPKMDVEEFYDKYRKLHKKILIDKDQTIYLKYLEDVIKYYESLLNYNLKKKMKRFSRLLWIVPLIVGIMTVFLIGIQALLQHQSGELMETMISPQLVYEQYFPPKEIRPFECCTSKFIILNCGESPREYKISIKGNGFFILENCSQEGNHISERTWTWTIPPDSRSLNKFVIWIDIEELSSENTLEIKVTDLDKKIMIFQKKYKYKRVDLDLSSNQFYYEFAGEDINDYNFLITFMYHPQSIDIL